VTNALVTPAIEAGEEISGLVRKLNRTDGISFVHEVLEELAERYGLDDAVIRIESPLGEGFFRLHRATVGPELASRVPVGPAVFFATPDVVPRDIAQSALGLCVVALRLCVSRRSRHLDRLTGLLNDHSFNDALEASAAQAARHGWTYTMVVFDIDRWAAEPSADDLRRFGTALRLSLRGGDIGSYIGEHRFAALLSNSDLDAVNPFLGRVYAQLHAAGCNLGLSLGAAATPTETVDPIELRRLAISRLQPGAPEHLASSTEPTASRWEHLELELRMLPPVVHVSRLGRRNGHEIISVLTGDRSPTVEASARRIVEAQGLDVDFEFVVLGEEEPPRETHDGPKRSGVVAGRSRVMYKSAIMASPVEAIVHLALGDRGGIGQSSGGELRGSAEATIQALVDLGIDAPVALASVCTPKGHAIDGPVRVVLSEPGSNRRYAGIARGATGAEAASRATLCALNGFLDGVPEGPAS